MGRTSRTILEVKDLGISFKMSTGDVHAIRGVDFSVDKGQILALVGESGCGKSITVKSLMGILPENAVINSGEALYLRDGEQVELLRLKNSERQKDINGSRIAMVFQDPMTSQGRYSCSERWASLIPRGLWICTRISFPEA